MIRGLYRALPVTVQKTLRLLLIVAPILLLGAIAIAPAHSLWSKNLQINGQLEIDLSHKGCSPGYWKTHKYLWDNQDFDYTGWVKYYLKFNQTFGVSSYKSGFSDWENLYHVLGTGGGGRISLARHAVAALANADTAELEGYPLTTAQVKDIYKTAVYGDSEDIGDAKDFFESLEHGDNDDCDLDNGSQYSSQSFGSQSLLGAQTLSVESQSLNFAPLTVEDPLSDFEIWAGIGELPDVPPQCDGMTFDKVIVIEDGDLEPGETYESADLRDIVFGSDGGGAVNGGDGDDCIVGNNGADELNGGPGDDVLIGGANADQLWGYDGTDWLYGDDGSDLAWGGTGPDAIDGGNGDDRCDGQEGANHIEACEKAPGPLWATATPDGGAASITVSWQGLAGTVSYNVYASTEAGGPASSYTIVGSTPSVQFDHLGLAAGETYYYRVTAVDNAGFESAFSPTAEAQTLAAATATPTSTPATATPIPTITPIPTSTPAASATAEPTATSAPTLSPTPTYTPASTNTPQPTATPTPTESPTPAPTDTPLPTSTPSPTLTETP